MTNNFTFSFGEKKVLLRFMQRYNFPSDLSEARKVVWITDDTVAALHPEVVRHHSVISIPSGEQYKTLQTVEKIITKLIDLEADRETLLIGFGGGVITDITGFVASIYMRGVSCGYVPTTLLAMVDAALGGKTGVDFGVYKNMLGTVTQPEFICYSTKFLETLPETERINGMAEVIKHACIRDALMLEELQNLSITELFEDPQQLLTLIRRNVSIKAAIVEKDVTEQKERRLLNFGHTLGHAIETLGGISHGSAVSIGMVIAARLSSHLFGLPSSDADLIESVCRNYGLPVTNPLSVDALKNVLKMDKKRSGDKIKFVILSSLGNAETRDIQYDALYSALKIIANES